MTNVDAKFKERASVMFGRPSLRTSNKKAAGSFCDGICSCFSGGFSKLMGFPTAPADCTRLYPAPKQLDPVVPCVLWEQLSTERRTGVAHVQVASWAKESTPGWVNQDATAACAAQGNGELRGDLAAGSKNDGALFFCVFDGHGKAGHEVAGIASERLPSYLAAHSGGPLSAPRKAIEAAFRKTDDDIYRALGERVEYAGSTGVAVVMDPVKRVLHVGNVGDSRAVIGQCSPSGSALHWSAIPLTSDLKPDIPEEKERIELSGGVVGPLPGFSGADAGPMRVWDHQARDRPGLAVSRSLGDGAARALGVIAEPVVTLHQLQPQDKFMLIATDGLWDSLGNEEAVRIAAKYIERNLQHVAVKALLEAVRREEGGQLVDDTTVILVTF
mmetsp:Transcript_132292/g.382463  ORF Transcript_132292/g.382463 Transcript_132292/m.382463 type:complete len:386 (-) Transcript_132292:95-1252(-)|eukprot:CAMPEP_0176104946 /NCGR_PEP_ID=MMETSP0120_2-20121206/52662_1 /TAXON_ID=160619 /ORGANISM="Kryptoperidinium foliaceum, Strain CCMP 1326" /LENGTH=385 /DNA_ID=CAMNT_0017439057 /DNA_START=80 /DNA_END=1237 /DNA_ORIENTATION=-